MRNHMYGFCQQVIWKAGQMREENRNERREAIEAAAYELLAEKGYLGTSMLAVARKAKASNETLYRWYGDKQGLFRSMVERNAETVRSSLEAALAAEGSAEGALQELGPLLLSLLTGDRAITLNRAAAADPSGELAQAIVQSGREAIAPLIGQLMLRARDEKLIGFDNVEQAVGLYLDLLVGDLQIRRVIGAAGPLAGRAISARAARALDHFCQLNPA
jgi:AcrR family transcriptional regulator